ncbi:unnamed protein product [Mesocestoides corti]|uniref:PDZ domain-containing protein n=1 Tax=Mesocestoides corti TaxID=53468 RepID=A0A158QV81_MESCO|nr:unnamed protein product [Mesocestoides corti]
MQTVEHVIRMRQGPPWGFRLADTFNGGLIVSQIRRQSPAEMAGLRENDVVVAINNISTRGLNRTYAINIINNADYQLDLIVQRQERRKPQMMTFFLDTSAARGQLVRQEMASRDLDITWRKEPSPPPPPPPPPPEPPRIVPADPNVTPVSFDRLMKKYDVPQAAPSFKKRTFANSAFYAGTNVFYPSVEEQIEMARRVAKSIEAPVNQGSRGAQIFEAQQQRAEKYVKEGPEPVPDPFENATAQQLEYMIPPAPPPPPAPTAPSFPSLTSSIPPAPPPPPPPPGQPRSVQEFIEKIRRFPKNTHMEISPQVCFDIAAALHTSGSRGGSMFAKRKAKAQNWEIENTGVPVPVLTAQHVEKPKLVSKLEQQHQQTYQQQHHPVLPQQQKRTSLTALGRLNEAPLRPQPPNLGVIEK